MSDLKGRGVLDYGKVSDGNERKEERDVGDRV